MRGGGSELAPIWPKRTDWSNRTPRGVMSYFDMTGVRTGRLMLERKLSVVCSRPGKQSAESWSRAKLAERSGRAGVSMLQRMLHEVGCGGIPVRWNAFEQTMDHRRRPMTILRIRYEERYRDRAGTHPDLVVLSGAESPPLLSERSEVQRLRAQPRATLGGDANRNRPSSTRRSALARNRGSHCDHCLR